MSMARALRSPVAGAAVDAYDRHVGRYGAELAREMVRVTGVRAGQRALDVGCGTGALTVMLAEVLGAGNVAAIDPSERFVAARRGAAEMRRVARPGGAVSACIWDFEGGMPLLRAVWDSALDVDAELARSFGADKPDPFSRPHELEELWCTTGFEGVELGQVDAGADYADFDDLWYPFANGVGNLGRFHEALDEAGRKRFKHGAAERLGPPSGPFRLTARAWYACGTVPA